MKKTLTCLTTKRFQAFAATKPLLLAVLTVIIMGPLIASLLDKAAMIMVLLDRVSMTTIWCRAIICHALDHLIKTK